jgi:hypothetical protein
MTCQRPENDPTETAVLWAMALLCAMAAMINLAGK